MEFAKDAASFECILKGGKLASIVTAEVEIARVFVSDGLETVCEPERERERESERVSEIDRDRERMLYVQMSSKTRESEETHVCC